MDQIRAPALYTIPSQLPFLDALVAGIFARIGDDPIALAETIILLPTRRAGRALAEAFLRARGGKAMLLPRMLAVGDIDAEEIELSGTEIAAGMLDLPPAIGVARRKLLLARLVLAWSRRPDSDPLLPAQAVALAGDLARFLDQAAGERLSFEALIGIVPERYAEHWQSVLEFLKIATEQWPLLLAAQGALDPAARNNQLIEAQLRLWRASPPQHPVIAAGFNAAGPATAELLGLVSLLPKGAVVLPGIDTACDSQCWDAVAADPTHPQYGLHRLLGSLNAAHEDIAAWPSPGITGGSPERAALAQEIMRPAPLSGRWQKLPPPPETALKGLTRIDCATPQEESAVIALLLRQKLETPGATAMLVTPDRGLARRVAAELLRWNIEIDDTAGIPLNLTPPGVFLRLIADAVHAELAPVALLSLLKHPLAGAGLATQTLRMQVRGLEARILRGPRPAPGVEGLIAATTQDPGARALVERIGSILMPFIELAACAETSLTDLTAAHLQVAEALAATDTETGVDRLWAGEAGESLAGAMTELLEAAEDFEIVAGSSYPPLFEALLAGSVVRPRFGRHPRLHIMGTIEARLLQADLTILAGLNEGIWPTAVPADPWMSRPMRQEFGLPSPDARIGLAAHDFVQAFSGPEVVLTRAIKSEGTPTVPSRWLLRLDTVLTAGQRQLAAPAPWRRWATALDAPGPRRESQPPRPRPPVSVRPRQLSVTEIETLRRDPYAIYARKILKLDELDPLDDDPGLAERGSFIHQALDEFLKSTAKGWPDDPLATLLEFGRTAFGAALERPGVWTFWWPRFERIAEWFVAHEAARRPHIVESFTEHRGRLEIGSPGGSFIVTAKADRIDRLASGGLAIIDYKTGGIPTSGEIAYGFSPQLPLEAAIAEAGGFKDVPAAPVEELAFWRLTGGNPPGTEKSAADPKNHTPGSLGAEAREGLEKLVRHFDDPATTYLAHPNPERAPRYSPYAHLARTKDWGGGGNE